MGNKEGSFELNRWNDDRGDDGVIFSDFTESNEETIIHLRKILANLHCAK